jgi:hypothetical protein
VQARKLRRSKNGDVRKIYKETISEITNHQTKGEMKNTTKEPALPVVKKSVKHIFTIPEIAQLNVDFRLADKTVHSIETEFDSIKASYKAKTTEAESRKETIGTSLDAGFEMRIKECFVVFRPADRKKDFHLKESFTEPFALPPILTEEMTKDDFEQDLLQAESAFESRTDLPLWSLDNDSGKIVVGKLAGKWFSAVRGNIGNHRLEERLDSEQKCFKLRDVAIETAGGRVVAWIETTLGKEVAKGFQLGIDKVLEAERGKVE